MIMRRLADAGVNVRFVYLATDTRVVIGTDSITQARKALGSSTNQRGLVPGGQSLSG